MSTKKQKIRMVSLIFLAALVLQTLPVLLLKPFDSKTMSNDYIELSYQRGEEAGAEEVFLLLNQKTEEIHNKLNAVQREPIPVFLYTTQDQLAIREAGFITLLFAPSWHIGDSHNGNIMLVSPNTPVPGHTHDSILQASLHELVHAINYRINPDLSYFWDNGLATYLAGQVPGEEEYQGREVPSLGDTHTENGLKFGNMGGYAFSYKYIEFLDQTYGWEAVTKYAAGGASYEAVFGKSEEAIYQEWKSYLEKEETELGGKGASASIPPSQLFGEGVGSVVDSGMAKGAIAAFVEEGEAVLTAGYGYANQENGVMADGNQTGFRIGSLSKNFVAAAALIAMEEGSLDLDTDITVYLEEDFPRLQYPVTMHHLLTHTGGFEENITGMVVRNVSELEPLSEAIRKYLPQQIFRPGEVVSYSNYGIALAAYTIEKATGTDFAEYCEERLFQPLGMDHTTFRPMNDLSTISKAYLPDGSETQDVHINLYPEGSAISTAADMTLFIQWLLSDEDLVLRRENKQLLFTQQATMSEELPGIGYTWNRKEVNGQEYVEKKGETLHFYSRILIYPEQNAGLFLSFNTYVPEDKIQAITGSVTEKLLMPAAPAASEVPVTPDISAEAGDAPSLRIAGNYVNSWSSFTTPEKLLRHLIPGKIIKIAGSSAEGYALDGEPMTHLGNDLYQTSIGKVHFLEKEGQILLATSFSQTYVKTGPLENGLLILLSTGTFVLSLLVLLVLSVFLPWIRKKPLLKSWALVSLLQLSAFAALVLLILSGISQYNLVNLTPVLHAPSLLIAASTIATGILAWKTRYRYGWVHGIISLTFCLVLWNLNLIF
jgi:CubicO group peptidase (beta-lactamase class C family)